MSRASVATERRAASAGTAGSTKSKPAPKNPSTSAARPGKKAGGEPGEKPRRSNVPMPYVVEASFLGAMAPGGTPPPPTFAEVAFAGRSNVGKSSLINCLVERKGLVRTSNTPGCTRQVNVFDVRTRDGARLVLADLPGYGFARRSKDERASWAKLIEEYLTTRPTLRALVVLVDARRSVEEEELELIHFVKNARQRSAGAVEVLLVATKVDKLPRSSAKSLIAKLGRDAGTRVLGFSSVTAEGRAELWKSLRRAMHLESVPDAAAAEPSDGAATEPSEGAAAEPSEGAAGESEP
jgi:GTP-binding protein